MEILKTGREWILHVANLNLNAFLNTFGNSMKFCDELRHLIETI